MSLKASIQEKDHSKAEELEKKPTTTIVMYLSERISSARRWSVRHVSAMKAVILFMMKV